MKLDKIIACYNVIDKAADSLIHITDRGIAYQAREIQPVEYGEEYFNRYVSYRGTETSNRINRSRLQLLIDYGVAPALDIGVGSGEFLELANESGFKCFGFDVNPFAVDYLKKSGNFLNPADDAVRTITLWDVLEHLQEPSNFLKSLAAETVIISIPILNDFSDLINWKHFKPGEHLYYFTDAGLVGYFSDLEYSLVYSGRPECECGREDIGSYVFRRA